MTGTLHRSECQLPRWQDGDAFESSDFEDEEEDDEEESSSASAEYGSLLGLGMSIRRKKPCIEVDAEEADNALRLVQHVAAQQLAGEDKLELGSMTERLDWLDPGPAPSVAEAPEAWLDADSYQDPETALEASDPAWDVFDGRDFAEADDDLAPPPVACGTAGSEDQEEPGPSEVPLLLDEPVEPPLGRPSESGPLLPDMSVQNAAQVEPAAATACDVAPLAPDCEQPRQGHSLRRKLPVAERRVAVTSLLIKLILVSARWLARGCGKGMAHILQITRRRVGAASIRSDERASGSPQVPACRDDNAP